MAKTIVLMAVNSIVTSILISVGLMK